MAGVLVISEEAEWAPAGWVFDHTLEMLVSELHSAAPELARVLANHRTSADGEAGGLDLRWWDRREMAVLARAVDDLHARFRAYGPEASYDRRFFPGFMGQLGELRAMLHSELVGQIWGQATSSSCSSLS